MRSAEQHNKRSMQFLVMTQHTNYTEQQHHNQDEPGGITVQR